MAQDKKKLSDDDILVLVSQAVAEGVGYSDSDLSKERTKVLEYYDSVQPKPSHKGNSKYVSNDVYESVEAMKATLLETFAAGTGIGCFAPQSEDDVEAARIATEYTDYVIFRQNEGYSVFQTVIHDGLLARLGVAKVYWDEIEEIEEETFEDANENQLIGLLEGDDVQVKTLEVTGEDPEGGLMHSGTIKRTVNKSQCRIEPVAPEEFITSPNAKSIKDSTCTHRTRKSKSAMRKMGFDEKKVAELTDDGQAWASEPEVLARFEKLGANMVNVEELQEATETTWLNETYMDLDHDGDGKTQLWKITWAYNTLLHKEQVKRKPFVVFVPLPRPHSLLGSNYADKVIATQNAKTVLTRGILDHTVITNNPRFTVLRNGLMRPDELMENRIGGIVNLNRPDAVKPLEQAPLNPFVFQTIQLVDYQLESTTGVSKLSQGMNKDAVSKQNSAALMEQLTTASMQRQKIVARNFAEMFLKPLYQMVYDVVLENEDRESIMEVSGNWVPVNPKTWMERKDYTIDLHLGYGERERQANELIAASQLLAATPFFGMKQQYATYRKILEFKGYKDISNFLMPIEEVKPPEPPPEIKLALAEIEIKKGELQLATLKEKNAHERALAQLQLETKRLTSAHALKADEIDVKVRAQEFDEKVANRELDQADEALKQTAEVKFTGIASANS